MTTPDRDTYNRSLGNDSVAELQADRNFPVSPNHLTWDIDDSLARLVISYNNEKINRKRERQARHNHGPDNPTNEYIIASTASWILTSLENDRHLRRSFGGNRPSSKFVEVKSGDNKVILNFVYQSD